MRVLQPTSLGDALAERSGAVPVAGATGVMVELHHRRLEADVLLDLSRVPELREISRDEPGMLRLGAAVTYTQCLHELAEELPLLAAAARTIANPQVRNRATLGGAVALADRTGDAYTALLACGTEVDLTSAAGTRRVTLEELDAVGEDELLVALHVRTPRGPTAYAKVGPRNAMVRASAAAAVALDPGLGEARIALAGPGPRPVLSQAAMAHAATAPWSTRAALDETWLRNLKGTVPSTSAQRRPAPGYPPDDYRARALGVLLARAFSRAWSELR